ncbi:MAG: hypothetical protein EAZ06_07950 [Cytophagales bacterium]|nr:MAG: hypothetical protein EAZ06_07950 [Cytophagales bacterium]
MKLAPYLSAFLKESETLEERMHNFQGALKSDVLFQQYLFECYEKKLLLRDDYTCVKITFDC